MVRYFLGFLHLYLFNLCSNLWVRCALICITKKMLKFQSYFPKFDNFEVGLWIRVLRLDPDPISYYSRCNKLIIFALPDLSWGSDPILFMVRSGDPRSTMMLFRSSEKSNWVKAIDSWFTEIKLFPTTSVSR